MFPTKKKKKEKEEEEEEEEEEVEDHADDGNANYFLDWFFLNKEKINPFKFIFFENQV